jgi:hypothetical protein
MMWLASGTLCLGIGMCALALEVRADEPFNRRAR